MGLLFVFFWVECSSKNKFFNHVVPLLIRLISTKFPCSLYRSLNLNWLSRFLLQSVEISTFIYNSIIVFWISVWEWDECLNWMFCYPYLFKLILGFTYKYMDRFHTKTWWREGAAGWVRGVQELDQSVALETLKWSEAGYSTSLWQELH